MTGFTVAHDHNTVLNHPTVFGGKALGLASLQSSGFSVPRWFCLGVPTWDMFLNECGIVSDGVATEITAMTPHDADHYLLQLQHRVMQAKWSLGLQEALEQAVSYHGLQDRPLAVRSSAIGEDSVDASFAGIFESELNVQGRERLQYAIQKVLAGMFSPRVRQYAALMGLPYYPGRLAIIIQELVVPQKSGVLFTRSPQASARAGAIGIAAHFGLGEGVVRGEWDNDYYEYDRHDLSITEKIATKTHLATVDPQGGTKVLPLAPGQQEQAVLSTQEVLELATIGLKLEALMGRAQDIEWLKADNQWHILQTRAVTTLPQNNAFQDAVIGQEIQIWDNSNIVESFGGLTLPLTYTHTQSCYAQVYEQFCRVMGVPDTTVMNHRPMFHNMLGLVRGRVYYNLLNWYRLVMLFPNADRSRGFMEAMMGVKSSLADADQEIQNILAHAYRPGSLKRLALVGVTVWRFIRRNRLIKNFKLYADQIIQAELQRDVSEASPLACMQRYRMACQSLMSHWATPIINDMRCMIFYGLYRSLAQRWLPQDTSLPTLHHKAHLFSTLPTRELQRLIQDLKDEVIIGAELFTGTDDHSIWHSIQTEPEYAVLRDSLTLFIQRYGCRVAHELKLETETLWENPLPVIQWIKNLWHVGMSSPLANTTDHHAGLPWYQRRVLHWLASEAAAAMADREELRFVRTKAFAVARRLFRAIGQKLAAAGLIDQMNDVFWLSVDELEEYLQGRSIQLDLKSGIKARKAEYAQFERDRNIPERFLTRGAVGLHHQFPQLWQQSSPIQEMESQEDSWVGVSSCAGKVEGEAWVAADFATAQQVHNRILITERTDPGWVVLFPACQALVIERGSLLSHSAIVARELGIPTVIGVSGIMNVVRSGERLEVDAGRGIVRRLT